MAQRWLDVEAALTRAEAEGGMQEALTAAPEIIGKLSEREIDAILDPDAYKGGCAQFVERFL